MLLGYICEWKYTVTIVTSEWHRPFEWRRYPLHARNAETQLLRYYSLARASWYSSYMHVCVAYRNIINTIFSVYEYHLVQCTMIVVHQRKFIWKFYMFMFYHKFMAGHMHFIWYSNTLSILLLCIEWLCYPFRETSCLYVFFFYSDLDNTNLPIWHKASFISIPV